MIVRHQIINKLRKVIRIIFIHNWRVALYRNRVAAGVEHAVVLQNLNEIQTVVDIGANRGQFALTVRYCFPDAKIISFEPLNAPASVYCAVFENDANSRIIEAAIGPEPGTADIHISARDDSSSLLPISKMQNTLFPGTSEVGTTSIRVVRMSDEVSADMLKSPSLLKLDVQGFELQALEGCEELLNNFAWVYVECSFVELYEGQAFADSVIAWLRERGFALSGVYNMAYDNSGKAVQADFLFHNNESTGGS